MPTIKKGAASRERAVRTFYEDVMAEITNKLADGTIPRRFLVRQVFGGLESLAHLSDSYAYDVTTSVLVTAVERGDLIRVGRFYGKPKKSKGDGNIRT